MNSLIIYHGQCPDGYGSAWWLGKHIGTHEKFAASYDPKLKLPDVVGRDVYIVDFCFPPDILISMQTDAKSILILDHHQTALDYIAGVSSIFNVHYDIDEFLADTSDHWFEACIDMNHSGVGLVAKYVYDIWDDPTPNFLLNLEDRDLWRFSLPETQNIFAAITSYPYTDEAWNQIWELDKENRLNTVGEGIERYRQKLIDDICNVAFLSNILGHEVWSVFCPYAVGSDVAGKLADKDHNRGFGAYFVMYKDFIKVGLRSHDEGMDVATLAQTVGGGGHYHAAGFVVPVSDVNNLFSI